jgi:hypothetical protein
MNNKKKTYSQTSKIFKANKSRSRNPISILLSTIIYSFIFFKTIQLGLFMNAFSYTIPKEMMKTNMLILNTKDLKNLKPEILNKYLDELEKKKEERKKNI